jgi:hypothetical protein
MYALIPNTAVMVLLFLACMAGRLDTCGLQPSVCQPSYLTPICHPLHPLTHPLDTGPAVIPHNSHTSARPKRTSASDMTTENHNFKCSLLHALLASLLVRSMQAITLPS